MMIRCPQCQTGYNLTAKQIGVKGRSVRCVKCKNEWFQAPITDEETAPAPSPAASTTSANDNAEKPPVAPKVAPQPSTQTAPDITTSSLEADKNKLKKKIIISVLGALTGLLLIFILLLTMQTTIVKNMPAFGGFYNVIGLGDENNAKVSITGLVIPEGSIRRTLNEGQGQPTLVFTGEVRNTNTEEVTVPEVRVTLLNEKGIEIDHWPAIVKKQVLQAGETTTWVCRFFDPPLDKISEHRVTFH